MPSIFLPDDSPFLLKLPDELLISIASSLHNDQDLHSRYMESSHPYYTDLKNLSRVSKRLHDTTEVALYKKVHIRHFNQLNAFLTDLDSNHDRAPMVQELSLSLNLIRLAMLGMDPHTRHANISDIASKIMGILSRTTGLQQLLLDVKTCNNYATHDLNKCAELSVQGRLLEVVSGDFLPRLHTLIFSNTRCGADFQRYSNVLAIPSLRKVVSLNSRIGHWDELLPPNTRYSHIKSLSVQRAGVTPIDIDRICELFPSLERLNITPEIGNSAFHGNSQMTVAVHQNKTEVNLSAALRKMHYLVDLSLRISRPRHHSISWGPHGGIDSLPQLTNLKNLELGIHMIYELPEVEMHVLDGPIQSNAVDVPKSTVLPPRLEKLTLYYCPVCSDFGLETVQHVLEYVAAVASQKPGGSLTGLKEVLLMIDIIQWFKIVLPFPDISIVCNSGVWLPGIFRESAKVFERTGIHFRVQDTSDFCCRCTASETFLGLGPLFDFWT